MKSYSDCLTYHAKVHNNNRASHVGLNSTLLFSFSVDPRRKQSREYNHSKRSNWAFICFVCFMPRRWHATGMDDMTERFRQQKINFISDRFLVPSRYGMQACRSEFTSIIVVQKLHGAVLSRSLWCCICFDFKMISFRFNKNVIYVTHLD